MKHALTLAMAGWICLVALEGQAEGKEKELEATLKQVVLTNFAASEKEDANAVMETLHADSPTIKSTSQVLEGLFSFYDLKYELLSFSFLVQDGDYAVARAKQKTTKIAGDEFKNNVLDSIYIFRQQDAAWKLWQQVVLETEFIN